MIGNNEIKEKNPKVGEMWFVQDPLYNAIPKIAKAEILVLLDDSVLAKVYSTETLFNIYELSLNKLKVEIPKEFKNTWF